MSYRLRLRTEQELLREPLPRVVQLLSTNTKTGTSINLPVINCRPTRRCAKACYACEGPITFKHSVRKTLVVDEALRKGEIEGLIWECRMLRSVRLNGSGDMTDEHVDSVLRLAQACPGTLFWGFTRKREIAEAVNGKPSAEAPGDPARRSDAGEAVNGRASSTASSTSSESVSGRSMSADGRLPNLSLIVTFDATSPDKELAGYEGPLAFGPRKPKDPVPDDARIIVVFPEHHSGRTIANVPLHPKDCPATRGHVRRNACQRCQRCWRPFEALSRTAQPHSAVSPRQSWLAY